MKKTIMIVEDNPDIRNMEKDIIGNMGYEVIEAINSKEAISLAMEKIPDLIIMDIRLPSKKRGIGAAKIIRNNEETKDIPIIFVTGYMIGEQSKEIQHIENHSYITKPFRIEALVEEIEKYLS